MKPIKIYSFFAGAGFLDLGFEDAGFDIDFVNEYNSSFLEVYKFARKEMNYKSPKYGYHCGDINSLLRGLEKQRLLNIIDFNKNREIIGFIGGPPCPDFSIAGKNKGINGKNGKLTNSYKNLILTYKPDFFVFENVKGLWTTKKHKDEYEKIKRAFVRKGYLCIDKLVNSIEYGVPQDRERIILFGIKYEVLCNNKKMAKKILEDNFKWNENKKYSKEIIGKTNWPTTSEFIEDKILNCPEDIIEELTVEYWFKKNNVYNHFNSDDFFIPQSTERFKTIKEGDVSKKSFKRLHRWRYSPTVAYGNNEVHLHPYKTRRLSVAEALAIQSMPKEFKIPKSLSKSNMFKTVGNGVPYLLSKAIATEIKKFIENNINSENKYDI